MQFPAVRSVSSPPLGGMAQHGEFTHGPCSFDKTVKGAQMTVIYKPSPAHLSKLEPGGSEQGFLVPDSLPNIQ